MEILREREQIYRRVERLRNEGSRIGFVPTMGALHEGHLALLRKAREENDIVVCSIFVNPTQFDDPHDFENYPEDPKTDKSLLEAEGCDILFLPSAREMYPEGVKPSPPYDPGYLARVMEGAFRKGHFEGVITIVHKLLCAVNPDRAYFGQKDYQQLLIIQKMNEELKLGVEVKRVDTQRDERGLALSSRNNRLSEEEQIKAGKIYEMLQYARQQKSELSPGELEKQIFHYLEEKGFEVEYFSIREANTLRPIDNWNGHNAVACVAVQLNGVRLIDNIVLD